MSLTISMYNIFLGLFFAIVLIIAEAISFKKKGYELEEFIKKILTIILIGIAIIIFTSIK